jgi:hypothetical protein
MWSPEPTNKNGAEPKSQKSRGNFIIHDTMPKFVIERNIPGAGKFSPEELKAISQTSCGALNTLGPQITWLHSYVTGDKIYCVYIAPNEEMVREHAELGGFPADAVSRVMAVIDPTTAEESTALQGQI